MRRSRLALSIVASLSLVLSVAGTAGASGDERHLNLWIEAGEVVPVTLAQLVDEAA